MYQLFFLIILEKIYQKACFGFNLISGSNNLTFTKTFLKKKLFYQKNIFFQFVFQAQAQKKLDPLNLGYNNIFWKPKGEQILEILLLPSRAHLNKALGRWFEQKTLHYQQDVLLDDGPGSKTGCFAPLQNVIHLRLETYFGRWFEQNKNDHKSYKKQT